jgi:hypothetical protein
MKRPHRSSLESNPNLLANAGYAQMYLHLLPTDRNAVSLKTLEDSMVTELNNALQQFLYTRTFGLIRSACET